MSTAEHWVSEVLPLRPVEVACAQAPAPAPSLLRRILVLADITAAALGWLIGIAATDSLRLRGADPRVISVAISVVFAALTVVFVAGQRLYLARYCSIRAEEINRLGRASVFSATVALVLPRLLDVDLRIRGALVGASLTFLFLVAFRGLYRTWLTMGRRDGHFVRPVVIVGDNDEAFDLGKLLRDHPELGFRVAETISDPDDVIAAVRNAGATGVIAAASAIPHRELNALVRTCLREGVHVHVSSGLRGLDYRRVRFQPLAHEPLMYVEPLRLAPWQVRTKRAVDVVGALVLGLVSLPFVGLAALAIKLDDGGPVFYRQRRPGRHGESFTIVKLRTMRVGADRLEPVRVDAILGPRSKRADDPRRTRAGRILEALSIDELPQLWNVLTGSMSLVGPRPALLHEAAQFDDELRVRETVRPGITGLWQVEARDNPSFSAYKRFDLFYIENWSVSLDIAILVATVQRVVLRGVETIARRAFAGRMTARDTRRAAAVPATAD